MAAHMIFSSNLFSRALLQQTEILSCVTLGGIRLASKKAASATKNKGRRTPGKSRGIKRWPGQLVEPGMVIMTQYGLRLMPGMNVGMSGNCTLYALERGKVTITLEKLQLNPESAMVKKFFAHRLNAPAIYKKFMHVIPDEIQPKFRLIDQV